MPSVARYRDFCSGHAQWPPRPNEQASINVFVNDLGWHRQSDSWEIHCDDNDCHGSYLKSGSATVYINNLQGGRITDPVACGSAVAQGSHSVYCGD